MSAVSFLATIFVILKLCLSESIEDEYPKIQHLFDLPEIDKTLSTFHPWDLNAQGVTIDIEKIDVNRLRRKLDKLPKSESARQWRAHVNISKTLFNKGMNETPPFDTIFNDSTPLNDTRRQKVPWYSRWYYSYATEFNTRVKIMDNALQTIYMARHKIMQMENDKYFNRKDTGYRIAFLYKNIRRLYRRLVDIFMTSKKYLQKTYHDIWDSHDHMAYMHQRAIKHHVDFLYYYWVMVEIDKRYSSTNKTEQTTPNLENIRSTTDPFVNYHNLESWLVWPSNTAG